MINRIPELSGLLITKADWERARKVCEFLETAENMTENQSGSSCLTLSMSEMSFKFFLKKCQKVFGRNDSTHRAIAEKMVRKLEECKGLVCSKLSTVVRILDPRFANDYWIHVAVLRRFAVVTKDVRRAG